MNFDKFKSIQPKPADIKEDAQYTEALLALKPRKKSSIFPIVGTVAASFIIIIAVTTWAIIGRGVRMGNSNDEPIDPIVNSPADSTQGDNNEEVGSKVYSVTVDAAPQVVDVPSTSLLEGVARFKFEGEDAKTLTELIESIDRFVDDSCYCHAPYTVYIGDNTYAISLNAEDSHIDYGGSKHIIDKNTADIIAKIFERKLTEDYQVTSEAMVLTVRDGFELKRYRFKNEHSANIYKVFDAQYKTDTLARSPEYTVGKTAVSAEYGISLKGKKPYIVSEYGVYYLTENEAKMLESELASGIATASRLEVTSPYQPPHEARVALHHNDDKYFFDNSDSDALIILLENYVFQKSVKCDCKSDVTVIPVQLFDETPRGEGFSIAFSDDNAHITRGDYHTVISKEDSEYIKQLLRKNCQKPQDDTAKATVTTLEEIRKSGDSILEYHEEGYIYSGKDAYVVGIFDDFIVLRPQGWGPDTYIKVPLDTEDLDIIMNDIVYMKGTVRKLATPIECETASGNPITYETYGRFSVAFKFDIDDINDTVKVVKVGDDYAIVEYCGRHIKVYTDVCEVEVDKWLYLEGDTSKTKPEKITLESGEEITVSYKTENATLLSSDMILVAKPVIYLYPETKTDVTVRVDVDGKLSCTYPAYDGSWQVTAAPDGTLTDKGGRQYYCLYWEADMYDKLCPDMKTGFVVKGKDTAEFLRQKALEIGLNEREANEFIIYWLPLMEKNEYNYIYFATDEYAKAARLDIEPVADTVIRFSMLWKALDAPIEVTEQKLQKTPVRRGFTVVEWGGGQMK